jgi:hypothetical protein
MRKKRRSKSSGKNSGDDTKISAAILHEARDTVLRRVKLIRKYDVPYLAGYSRDGKRIYIDRELPRTLSINGRRVEVDPFLVLHESVEKSLVDQLGLKYQFAHQLALRVEEAAVRDAGISWRRYNALMEKYIKIADEDPDLRIPPDLDLEPYVDEHDAQTLARMRKAQRNGSGGSKGSKSKRSSGRRKK